jgi:hypothetical protein
MLFQYASLYFCHIHWKPDDDHVQNLLKRWEFELKQAFIASIPSPVFSPRLQGYPMMPGRFPDDGDDQDDEQIYYEDQRAMNEPDSIDGVVHAPATTPLSASPDNSPNTPSPRSKKPTQARPSPKWQFIPYHCHPEESNLNNVVIIRLKSSFQPSGYIYIMQRPSDPEYLKIGYTTQDPDTRLEEWRRSCLSPYIRLYSTNLLPNVKRVESLIHADLRPVRYSESHCKDNPACKVQHTEWFKVSFDRAKATVAHWALWMTVLEPYGNDGLLKDRYVVQMFHEIGLASILRNSSRIFIEDSDGKSWVDHTLVMRKLKGRKAASPPSPNTVPLPRGARNKDREQLPSTPSPGPSSKPNPNSTPAYLAPDSRTSSSSGTNTTVSTSSIFSTVSTTSTASTISMALEKTLLATSPGLFSSKSTNRLSSQ